jgi:hypothetical protein
MSVSFVCTTHADERDGVVQAGLPLVEGMICKRRDGVYSSTAGWLKVMNSDYTQHEGRQEMFTAFRERPTRMSR